MNAYTDNFWTNSYSQAATALSEGRYADAHAIFDVLLGYIESRYGATDLRAAACHQGLGESNNGIGNIAEAERHFKRAIAILERHLGALHAFTLKAVTALGVFYRRTKQSSKAEIQLSKALHGWSQLSSLPALDVCETLDNLAGLYCDQGREQEAQPLINQAILIRQKNLAKDRSEAIKNLTEYAELQAKRLQFHEAEVLMKEALQMMESYYGRNDLHVAELLMKMAMIARADFRPADAIPFMERALCIQSLVYGDQDDRVIKATRKLGNLFMMVGRGPQATTCFEDSLEISKKMYGETSLEAAADLHKLAFISLHMETYDKAENRALAALKIFEEKLGKSHPNVLALLKDLADIYTASGRTNDATTVDSRFRETLQAARFTSAVN